jgi:hypothetical protein
VASSGIVVAGLAVGTMALRAAGPVALGGRELPERALSVIALVAPAVLAGLVVFQTFSAHQSGVVVDARVAGLGVAGAAVAARLPPTVVVLLAAAATAGLRALT